MCAVSERLLRLVLLSWACVTASAQPVRLTIDGASLLAMHASDSAPLPELGLTLSLVAEATDEGCRPFRPPPTTHTPTPPFALLVSRGGCSFDAKARLAVSAGASALLVADSLRSHYGESSGLGVSNMRISDPCLLDCTRGRVPLDVSTVSVADVHSGLGGRCGCAMCALAAGAPNASTREACCVADAQLDMAFPTAPERKEAIPAIFLPFSAAAALHSAASAGGGTTLHLTDASASTTRGFDFSAIGLLLFGSATAVFGARHAARTQHSELVASASSAAHGRRAGEGAPSDAPLSLSAPLACGFLVMATSFLLILYGLLQAGYNIVLLLIVIFFSIAGTNAISTLLAPSVASALPRRVASQRISLGRWCAPVPLPTALSMLPALALSATWFIYRREAWAWPLQDVLGAAVSFVFLLTLRLPSLRVAAVLEGAMFFYDIFMVFLSPLIFKTSVMMSVATAGEPSALAVGGECVRFAGEPMPMLLKFPRLFWGEGGGLHSSAGEYAMLGLGDIVLPGLLLTFACRVDMAIAYQEHVRPPRMYAASYFRLSAFGYLLGLSLAFGANAVGLTVLGVKGQPALLYLVPCTLGAVTMRAWARGQLASLWSGSVLDPPATHRSEEMEEASQAAGIALRSEYKSMP